MDARVELGHHHLHRVAEALPQRVERPDVVGVAMRQGDPSDRGSLALGCGDDRVGAAAGGRVDQREPVLLANQIGIDKSQPRELDQVVGNGNRLHANLPVNEIGRTAEQAIAVCSSSPPE